MGFTVLQQKKTKSYYEGEEVGDYESDLIVNDVVIVEAKAKESLREEHEAQLINYLKATKIEAGLLLNFSRKPEFRRKVFFQMAENKIRENPRYSCHPRSKLLKFAYSSQEFLCPNCTIPANLANL